MKKILFVMLCVILVAAVPIVVFAEEPSTEEVTEPTITETIVSYVRENIEELSVIGSLVAAAFLKFSKDKKLNGAIGTLNNNAIAVAENSANAIKTALSSVEDVAKTINDYKAIIENFLAEMRKSAEEKKSLEDTLTHVETFLKSAKLATLELSNEVAELLVLANIPTSKKDELYARHTKAVHELEAAEEVMNNDGEKT